MLASADAIDIPSGRGLSAMLQRNLLPVTRCTNSYGNLEGLLQSGSLCLIRCLTVAAEPPKKPVTACASWTAGLLQP